MRSSLCLRIVPLISTVGSVDNYALHKKIIKSIRREINIYRQNDLRDYVQHFDPFFVNTMKMYIKI